MQSHPDEEDDDYKSAEDEDFDPDAAAAAEVTGSSDDEGTSTKGRGRRKASDKAEDFDFENSGDEATLRKGRRRKKRKAQHDEDGGDGGLIKTRAQRLVETKQPSTRMDVGKATVNVDDLWAQMSSTAPPPSIPPAAADVAETNHIKADATEGSSSAPLGGDRQSALCAVKADLDSVSVTIKRTYEFAGKTEVEERVVPAQSAEAKLYLAEQSKTKGEQAILSAPAKQQSGLRKPMKRKSMFASTDANESHPATGPKLNTLQKSKLDWAQQVDKEGIADELDEHSRAKDSYASRMEFLGRMEAKRDEGTRGQRLL